MTIPTFRKNLTAVQLTSFGSSLFNFIWRDFKCFNNPFKSLIDPDLPPKLIWKI